MMRFLFKVTTIVLPLSFATSCVVAQTKFIGKVTSIPIKWQQQMVGRSWQKNCPVQLSQLGYLKLSYWGYDNTAHLGTLVVNKKLALETISIFRELYKEHFPIEEMKPYATYPVGTYANHNDTVGFYCRPAQDKPSDFSSHSYGIAIDINPLVNPFYDIIAKAPWPKLGAKYMNRSQNIPGMVKPNGPAFTAFTKYGWRWGGFWRKGTDYMHFEKLMNAHYIVSNMSYRPNNSNPKLPE